MVPAATLLAQTAADTEAPVLSRRYSAWRGPGYHLPPGVPFLLFDVRDRELKECRSLQTARAVE